MGKMELSGLKRIWRILVCVAVAQGIGSLLVRAYSVEPFQFSDFWLGGAVASPVGFVLGLAWHLSKSSRRKTTPVILTVCLGLFTFVVGTIALFETLPSMRIEVNLLQDLKQLEASHITSISIFEDDFGKKKLVALNDRETINDFVSACRDAQGYSPSHDRHGSEWFLELHGASWSQFRFYTNPKYPELVIGNFVAKEGNKDWSYGYGYFSSKRLREWFESMGVIKR
jgi:hypothetical protein